MGFWDSGISQGLNQATGTMLNTGMQLYQHKAKQAIQQEQLRIEQEESARRNKLLDMEIAQKQDDTRLIDVEDQLDRIGFKSPEEKQWWYSQPEIQLDIQEFGGRKTLQKKKAIDHLINIAKDPAKNIELGNIRLTNYSKQIDSIEQQLADPESKLKPEQVDTLNKQLAVLKQQRITSINHIAQEQKKIQGETQPKLDEFTVFYHAEKEKGTSDSDIISKWQNFSMQKSKAGATNVNISTKVGEESMTKLGGEMSKQLVEERKDVQGAVKALENIKEAKTLLNSGMITGTGAEYLVNFGNLLQSRLGIDTGKGAYANSQAYAATMGNQVGQIIKQFGSGTGLSDADREYAEKIVGGTITLNEQAIRKLLAINEKAFNNVIRNFNKKAKQAMSKKGAEGLPYDLTVDYDDNGDQQTSNIKNLRAKYNY